MTRRRLTVLFAFAAFALVVAFAVADSIVAPDAPSTDAPQRTVSGFIEGSAGTPLTAPDSSEHEPYTGGLQARLPGSSKPDKAKECKGEKRCEKKNRDGDDEETVETVAAAFGPTDSGAGDNSVAPPCTDTDSCVGQIKQLIPRVHERVSDLPLIRECTSSIGGDALCFDFGDGNYLVGDAPHDGETELGFCTPSGYYYVAGPKLEGGAGVACPGEPGQDGNAGHAPTARECTSSIGGDATCFDFGDGKYIVSDSPADGGGELGFCTNSGYYYVSAPSGTGEAGDAKCPDAPPAG